MFLNFFSEKKLNLDLEKDLLQISDNIYQKKKHFSDHEYISDLKKLSP